MQMAQFDTSAPAPIRIVVIDHQQVVRQSLVHYLTEAAGMQVLAQAPDIAEVLDGLPALNPDVVVMDPASGPGSLLGTLALLRTTLPKTPIIILSGPAGEIYRTAALSAGACGYFAKGVEMPTLVTAIQNCVGRPGVNARWDHTSH